MSTRLEIHPGQGGLDSEMFATDVANSISKATGLSWSDNGRVISFSCL